MLWFVCLFFSVLDSNYAISRTDTNTDVSRLTSDNFRCCHTGTEGTDYDFCLSRSHYADTELTSRERVPGVRLELKTS